MTSSAAPSDEYQRRKVDRERRVADLERLHLRLGNLRLLIVIGALVAAWFSLHRDAFSPLWLLSFLVGFVFLAIFHAKVLRRRAAAERSVDFYKRGVARIEDRWMGSGQIGERIDTSTSLYASDLDLFGRGSLFELLSLARTRMGEDTLARWLLHASPVAKIRERQAAVAELRGALDLREHLATLGDNLEAGIHPDALTVWAEAPTELTQNWLRWLAVALAIAAVATAVLWAQTGAKTPFFLIVVVESILTAAHRKQTAKVLRSTGDALSDLKLLSALLHRLEQERFESSLLQEIAADLSSHKVAASQAIAGLGTIVEFIHSLENPAMRLLDIPLLYSVQTAYAAEAWRRVHGRAVRHWLGAIGEMEALLSLSGYSYEHPADPFPEFVEGEPCFTAAALGHPLVPEARCVRNSVTLCGQTRVLLVSGSNMSGKSTLMRSVGINTVLAMAGAPVRAEALILTPLQVGASILINDSLHEGSSRFYAEITRLRAICDLAEKHPPVLFLLDELLQGTNSKDRLIGAEGVVRSLLADGSIGLISTHDLALTGIGDAQDHRLRNVHFQDRIEDGRMKFDYTLQDGVVTRSNGVALMQLIGLKV